MGKTGTDRDDDAASSGSDGLQQGLTNRYRVHFPLNDAGGHDPIREARDVTAKYSSRCEPAEKLSLCGSCGFLRPLCTADLAYLTHIGAAAPVQIIKFSNPGLAVQGTQ